MCEVLILYSARFAMAHPERVWGVVLINCSAVEGPDSVDTGFLVCNDGM